MRRNFLVFTALLISFYGITQTELIPDEVPNPVESSTQSNEFFECTITNVLAQQINLKATIGGFTSDLSTISGRTAERAENFKATKNAYVNELCWIGFYFLDYHEFDDVIDDFKVIYYDDNGGFPGNIIGGPFPSSVVTRSHTEDFYPNVYGYHLSHDPVPVSTGEIYWVSIVNNTASLPTDQWVWFTTTDFTLDPLTASSTNGAPFIIANVGGGVAFTVGYIDRIPTISQWGIIGLMLTFLIVGTVALRSRSGIKSWV